MVNVPGEFIFCAFRVLLHPSFDCLPGVMRSAVLNAAATVRVHPAHDDGLDDLDEGVMDILVRPLLRLADCPPFPGAYVPALGDVRLLLLEAVDQDFPQLSDALLLGLLNPGRCGVRPVMGVPMVGVVLHKYLPQKNLKRKNQFSNLVVFF